MRALVTGAAGGIGRALCDDLEARGYRVIVHARSEEKARSAASGGRQIVWGDLATPEGIAQVARQIDSVTARLDLLVHNAGVLTTTKERGGHGLGMQGEVNVVAPAKLTLALLPKLRASPDPTVLIVSSGIVNMIRRADIEALAEPDGSSLFGHYALSKTGANRLTVDLGEALEGVRVVSVEPGFVKTAMTDGNASMPWVMRKLAPLVGASPEKAAKRCLDTVLSEDVTSGTVLQGAKRVESGGWTKDGAREGLARLLGKAGVSLADARS